MTHIWRIFLVNSKHKSLCVLNKYRNIWKKISLIILWHVMYRIMFRVHEKISSIYIWPHLILHLGYKVFEHRVNIGPVCPQVSYVPPIRAGPPMIFFFLPWPDHTSNPKFTSTPFLIKPWADGVLAVAMSILVQIKFHGSYYSQWMKSKNHNNLFWINLIRWILGEL